MGTIQIDKPSRGRVVEYRDHEGRVFAGTVDRFYEESKRGEVALIYTGDAVYFTSRASAFVASDVKEARSGLAERVPYDADGTLNNSWRYPPRVTDKIDVER